MNRGILVVDVDTELLAVVATILEEEGYRVRRAVDGAAALGEIGFDPPDLVLADLETPQLDGLSLAHLLHTQHSAIPVVLLGAGSDFVALPGVRFLRIPFELDELLQIVAQSLVAHQTASTAEAPL